jgi:hypothetical protein
MSDTQRKHYEEMSECLLGFRAGTMRLGDLVERLPELVKELGDDIDPTWKAAFVSQWWTLEQIHGQAIDLGESTRMPTDTRRTVDDAVASLDELVRQALSV